MKHEKDVGFWSTFGGVTAHPWRALGSLAEDQATLRKGLLALVLVLGAYTAILAIFIAKGYPAVNPSVLPISVEEHYSVQIWYQGPLFFLTTLATAGFLVLCAYALGQSAGYPLAFTRISFASTVPFFFTTMFVELVMSLLLLAGVVQPASMLAWIKGEGSWFATAYQLVGMIWLVALFVIVAKQTAKRSWMTSVLLDVATILVYAAPVGLFIR